MNNMSERPILHNDICFIFLDRDQLETIKLLKQYAEDRNMSVDYRDKFPRDLGEERGEWFKQGHAYKYDIQIPLVLPGMSIEEKTRRLMDPSGGQFIVDEDRLVIRAFYHTQDFSVSQRENVCRHFLTYLHEEDINYESPQLSSARTGLVSLLAHRAELLK